MNKPARDRLFNGKIANSPWITLAILSCMGLMVMFADTMVLPAIPDLIRDFGITYNASSWILASFLITGAVMTPIAGRLSDMYGKKKMLFIIVGIYTIGVSVAAISTNFSILIIARIMQGVGASMFAISFGIVRDKFTPEKLAVAQGIFSSMFSAGAVIGVAIGGTIINTFGWHATFLLVIPIAVALFAAITRFIHLDTDKATRISDKNTEFCCRFIHVRRDILLSESSTTTTEYTDSNISSIDKNRSTIDLTGAITLSITVVSFLVALQFIQTVSASNSSNVLIVIGFGAAAIFALSFFIIIERKANSPLIDFKLLINKILLPANIINMIVGITALMVVYQTVPILIRSPQPLGFGGNALSIANVQLPYMMVSLVVSIASGFIVSKFGNQRPTVFGIIISIAGFLSMFVFHSTEILITINLVIIATGLSLTQIGSINIILVNTPRQSNGVSLGMTTLLYLIGTSVGPVLAGVFMQANQTLLPLIGSFPAPQSYNLIFLTAAIMSVLSIILVGAMTGRKTKPEIVMR
ncbi:MAG TPA: MFS transporter [Candidatus Nitrosopolaris sp.]|nr:MFS transporter [Candidatus Nitrosopolaris sp.]